MTSQAVRYSTDSIVRYTLPTAKDDNIDVKHCTTTTTYTWPGRAVVRDAQLGLNVGEFACGSVQEEGTDFIRVLLVQQLVRVEEDCKARRVEIRLGYSSFVAERHLLVVTV